MRWQVSEQLILDKLDEIKDDIHDLTTEVALNQQAYNHLNAELQEHKRDGKWKANRNIAIVAILFTALGCWVGLKGLDNGKYAQPPAIIKEINSNDNNTNDK